ncbi:hypothetical protein [Nitrosomonas supralitoralis]|uniref:PsbP C-terminal domain-containing protein n=1 Tax=Nitrosomonas supralitoralis TaxID=2116706 RepID=A0A2P7NSH1_9PROT|nr:hypothetical protein [Nitrosomonas supralitoralis]PSJ16407.1 hypothetical protein C7H79_13525 [Nitrosomonas supralitoralis]
MKMILATLCFLLFLNPAIGFSQDYKVFKGDGFSFRYPSDWQEGLSQAPTTRALVRAISAQTGYAASCNVNVSFVDGLDQFTQTQINQANHRVHDLKYLSRIKNMMPDVNLIEHNTDTLLSMQPASSVEYTALIRSQNESQMNRFFQIMTIRKPNRYVVTCRGEPMNYMKAKGAINLIVSTFGIWSNLVIP